MNENINLCELLKGHEGEIFYSPAFGDVEFVGIGNGEDNEYTIQIKTYDEWGDVYYITSEGKFNDNGECILFPSKDQRDWNKWAEEQKPKAPKTWSEMKSCNVEVWQAISHLDYGSTEPILKSAVALLKIHQLIEEEYGGNITKEERENLKVIKRVIIPYNNSFEVINTFTGYYHVSFHTYEQAKKFLSYPENIQLIKDFYMI